MKRIISTILVFLTIFSLCGCANSFSDRANFYYCSIDFQFGKDEPVIQAESRNISGHEGELSYLLSLYLAGPSSKELTSPFPANTKLVSLQTADESVTIELSYLGKLTEAEFILACACITLTAIDFTGAEQVTIVSGEKTLTMSKDDLLLLDTITAATEMEAVQ